MKVLLPFFDDSTLIFAARMKALFEGLGSNVTVMAIEPHGISPRQVNVHLAADVDKITTLKNFGKGTLAAYDAVVTCRVPAVMFTLLKDAAYMASKDRPKFVAFQPGLEFTPERGMKNRRHFDSVFLNSENHKEIFLNNFSTKPNQFVSFGHPYFVTPDNRKNISDRKNIYFFSQAISPNSLNSRRFIVDILATLARRYPDRTVYIKLRHLPDENINHVHKEKFPYHSIIQQFSEMPINLKLTACSMKEALEDAAIAITCTSTAVMDAISAGVPALIYIDYVENYSDPLSEFMHREFKGSGLIADIPQLMSLSPARPNQEWMRQYFRTEEELIKDILLSVTSNSF